MDDPILTDPRVREVIKRARKRIADESRWCRVHHAETRAGELCLESDRRAYRFSAVGALVKEALPFCDGNVGHAMRFAFAIAHALDPMHSDRLRFLYDINDQEGHKAVLELFHKASA